MVPSFRPSDQPMKYNPSAADKCLEWCPAMDEDPEGASALDEVNPSYYTWYNTEVPHPGVLPIPRHVLLLLITFA